MTPITIAHRASPIRTMHGSNEPAIRISGTSHTEIGDNLRAGAQETARPERPRSEFLGGTKQRVSGTTAVASRLAKAPKEVEEDAEVRTPEVKAAPTETLEKVVRRIPTLYVIALFAVIVLCAVLMIWNTLRVNALTTEKTRNQERIAQTEQRLIKLRAEEMQLSGPSRIRDLAKAKFGMVDVSGEDLVIVR